MSNLHKLRYIESEPDKVNNQRDKGKNDHESRETIRKTRKRNI